MKLNVSKILLKKSTTANNPPKTTDLEIGEVALNCNEERPFLSFKTSGTTGEKIDKMFKDTFVLNIESGVTESGDTIYSANSADYSAFQKLGVKIEEEYKKNGIALLYNKKIYTPYNLRPTIESVRDGLVFYYVELEENNVLKISTFTYVKDSEIRTFSFVYEECKTLPSLVVDLVGNTLGEISFSDTAMTANKIINVAKENGNIVVRLVKERFEDAPIFFQLAAYNDSIQIKELNFISFAPSNGSLEGLALTINPSTNPQISLSEIQLSNGQTVKLDGYTSPQEIIESGLTDPIDASMTLNKAIAALVKVITDNELTISSAFNDLNARITDLEEQIANL